MLPPRNYQATGVPKLIAALHDHRRVVGVAPTGAGKTVIAAMVIMHFIADGMRCMFLAHRKELIDQTSAMLHFCGVAHGVMMGKHHLNRPDAPVQVASVQTLMAKRRCVSCRNKD